LFDVDRSVVAEHLKNIFDQKELDETSTCANYAQVAYSVKTYVIDTFSKQGYVLDKSRLIHVQIFDKDYFEHLIKNELTELNEIVTMYLDYATRQARR
jgi:hypothetical protein